MARLGPILVRDVAPPASLIPEDAWSEVVRRVGHMTLGFTKAGFTDGSLGVQITVVEETVDAVREILREQGALERDDDEDGDGPWSLDADWWK